MFTLQSNQLQSAIRSQFGNTPTAQDMVQALCNCAQVVQHRGPMQFEFQTPEYGAFPGLAPPPGLAPLPPAMGGAPQPAGPNFTIINPPPWQPIQWDTIPFIDWPAGGPSSSGGGSYFPGWGGGNGSGGGEWGGLPWAGPMGGGGNSFVNLAPFAWQAGGSSGGGYSTTPAGGAAGGGAEYTNYFAGPQYTMNVAGPSYIQNVDSRTMTTQEFYTQHVTNQGDNYTYGDTYTEGDTYIGGDTVHEGDVTNQGDTVHQGGVTNQGPVINEGPQTHLGDEHHYGQNTFHTGPIFFAGPVVVGGQTLNPKDIDVLRDVELEVDPTNPCVLRLRRTVALLTVMGGLPDRDAPTAGISAPRQVTIVTDVEWDDTTKTFSKTTRQIDYFGCGPGAETDADVFVAKPAKFDSENCEIAADTDNPPQYSPIGPPEE